MSVYSLPCIIIFRNQHLPCDITCCSQGLGHYPLMQPRAEEWCFQSLRLERPPDAAGSWACRDPLPLLPENQAFAS